MPVKHLEPKAKILVIDDEALIAQDLESRLKALGYSVCGKAAGGEQALELVKQHQPDLVIMDIVIQGEMDGIDTAEIIRNKWGVPVVFLTAYADTDKLERAKLAHPFGYLLKPFQDNDLKITMEMALYAAKVDVKRRKAEDELRQSQMLLDSIIENIPSTLFLKDAEELRFVRVNRATEELTGIPREELYGKNDYDFVPKKQADYFTGQDRAVLEGEEAVEIKEEELQTREKGVRILNTRKIPLFNEKGEPKYLLGISHDITERKQAEKELQLTLEAVTDGIWSWEFKTNELSFSSKYYTMLGYEPDEFSATYENWVSLIHPDDLESALAVANNYLKAKPDIYENEFRLKTKAGDYLRVITRAKVVERDENGEAVRMIGNHQDITERKLAEEALLASEEKYRTLFENMEQGAFYQSFDGALTDVNEATLHIFGVTRDQFLGRTSMHPEWKVIYEDGAELPGEKHPSMVALRTGKPVKDVVAGVYNPIIKDFSWIIINAIPQFKPGEEKPYQAFVTIHDITDRKRAEQALEQALHAAERQTEELQFLLNGAKTVLEGNDFPLTARRIFNAACEMTGAVSGYVALLSDDGEENEVLFLESGGLPCSVDESLPMPIRGLRGEAYRTGQAVFENDFMKSPWIEYMPHGHVELGNVMFAPLNIESKTVGIMGLANKPGDFTEDDRRMAGAFGQLAAIALKNSRTMEALIESKAIIQAAMDNSQAGIAIVDAPDGKLRYVNDAGLFIRDGSQEEGVKDIDIEQYVGSWRILHLDGTPYEPDEVPLARAVKYGEISSKEFIIRRSETEDRIVLANAAPIRNESGKVIAGIVVFHDITELRTAEKEGAKLNAQLQQAQKMEAIGTLTGGVAHDFNNLLQAINGYTQLLLMDKSKNDPEYQSLAAIQDSGKRAADLVCSLLLFSRKAETERKPLELNIEIEHARKILERTIPKMVEIDVHTGRRLWTIMADPVQVEQLLLNIGANAADAMPDGGKLVINTENIKLEEGYAKQHAGAQPGRYVLLTISDTGHGMDRETREKIFEPFFTTKEFGKGTGLGLASVYGIVKKTWRIHHVL